MGRLGRGRPPIELISPEELEQRPPIELMSPEELERWLADTREWLRAKTHTPTDEAYEADLLAMLEEMRAFLLGMQRSLEGGV